MPDFVILSVSQKIQAERKEVQRFKRSDISQGNSEEIRVSAEGQIMNPHNKEKREKSSLSTIPGRAQMEEGWQHQSSVAYNIQSRESSNIDAGGPGVETDSKLLFLRTSCMYLYICWGFYWDVTVTPVMITDVICFGFSFRGDKERALSSSGLLGMGGVREITVTVMGTRTVSTPSPSAVPRSKAYPPGTLRSAPLRWPPRTAAGITPTSES